MVAGTVNAAKAYASNIQVYAHLWSEKYSQVLNRQLCETVPVARAVKPDERGHHNAGSVASDKKSPEEFTLNRGYYVMETFKREVSGKIVVNRWINRGMGG